MLLLPSSTQSAATGGGATASQPALCRQTLVPNGGLAHGLHTAAGTPPILDPFHTSSAGQQPTRAQRRTCRQAQTQTQDGCHQQRLAAQWSRHAAPRAWQIIFRSRGRAPIRMQPSPRGLLAGRMQENTNIPHTLRCVLQHFIPFRHLLRVHSLRSTPCATCVVAKQTDGAPLVCSFEKAAYRLFVIGGTPREPAQFSGCWGHSNRAASGQAAAAAAPAAAAAAARRPQQAPTHAPVRQTGGDWMAGQKITFGQEFSGSR